jgi:hypothetical protein
MRHDAFGIVFERLGKAFDALRSVEGKAPVQTKVEPALSFRRTCRNRSGVAAKVETIHLSNSRIAWGARTRYRGYLAIGQPMSIISPREAATAFHYV